jgi:hypothetical protein
VIAVRIPVPGARIDGAQVIDDPIAVVVDPIAILTRTRKDGKAAVVAVEVIDRGSGRLLAGEHHSERISKAIAIRVRIEALRIGRLRTVHLTIAVTVQTVADLIGVWVHFSVSIVAVAPSRDGP